MAGVMGRSRSSKSGDRAVTRLDRRAELLLLDDLQDRGEPKDRFTVGGGFGTIAFVVVCIMVALALSGVSLILEMLIVKFLRRVRLLSRFELPGGDLHLGFTFVSWSAGITFTVARSRGRLGASGNLGGALALAFRAWVSRRAGLVALFI